MDSRLEFIYRRRSVRQFKPEPVEACLIEELLRAAMAAPSAVARDPWRFILLRERCGRETVAGFLPNGKFLAEAPLGVVVCGDIAQAHDNALSYMLQDCSAAIENILLAASAIGLGACWLGVHPREDRIRNISSFCQLPSNVIPIAVIALGYPECAPEPRTRYNPAFVKQEKWS